MIKVLSFLSNENCFAGHSRGRCGSHVAHGSRFEHHCPMSMTDFSSSRSYCAYV